MPEFNVSVEFDVYCSCGEALCNQSTAQDYRRSFNSTARSLTVEPCARCLEKARDAGYDEGADDAASAAS